MTVLKDSLVLEKEYKYKGENIIALIFYLPLINYFINEILFSMNMGSVSSVMYIVIYLTSIISYIYVFIKKPIKSTLIFLTMGIVYTVSIIINNDIYYIIFNTPILQSNFMKFWALCFPIFIQFLLQIDIDKLLEIFYKYSIVTLVLYIISFILNIIILKIGIHEYMTFAYSAMMSIMICLHYGIHKKKKVTLFLVFVSSIVTLVGGCRGALLTLISFYTLYFIFMRLGKKSILMILKGLLILTLIISILVNIDNIIIFAEKTMEMIGYNSRVFENISEGSFFESDGRTLILRDLIRELNAFGHGLYSDRIIAGSYAHNWVLEILVHFGVLGGGLIIITIFCFMFIVIKHIIYMKNINYYFFIVSMASSLFVKHFLSASYLSSAEFWLFFGIMYNIIVNKKYTQKEINIM